MRNWWNDDEIDINISGNSVSSSALPTLELHFHAAAGSARVGSERILISMLDNIARRYLEKGSFFLSKLIPKDISGMCWMGRANY